MPMGIANNLSIGSTHIKILQWLESFERIKYECSLFLVQVSI